MTSLEQIVKDGAEFVKKEFGLEIDTNILKYYSNKDWNEFCEINNFNSASEGIYVPGGKAYVRNSPYIASNIFHEVYGHALFCEHSIPGKILLEKQKQGIAKDFLKKECESTFNLTGQNLADYEGFAMWMESVICKETGRADIWEKKKDNMHEQYVELWKYFMSAEEKLTRYGLMAQMGFPKEYNSKKVVEVIKNIYGKNFDNIELILAYGSKKPNSDIDLFILSKNNRGELYNGWLDIYEVDNKNFEFMLNNFDISVTDPIISGELIYGSSTKLQKIKEDLISKPINNEAIQYNNKMAELNLEASKKVEDSRLRNNGINYSKSYSLNALELSQGRRPLTLKKLEEKYGVYRYQS